MGAFWIRLCMHVSGMMRLICSPNSCHIMTIDEFHQVAQDLELLRFDPQATLFYEIMSDALVWSDEIPQGYVRRVWCMRPLFRYRTGLILGLNLQEFEDSWGIAKSILHKWI